MATDKLVRFGHPIAPFDPSHPKTAPAVQTELNIRTFHLFFTCINPHCSLTLMLTQPLTVVLHGMVCITQAYDKMGIGRII